MTQSLLQSPFGFRLRKVARYVRLYGPSRTLAKVRSQVHMSREEGFSGTCWSNPKVSRPEDPGRAVAIAGCGNFAYSTIAHYLRRERRRFLRATFDVRASRARSLSRDYGGAYATTMFEEILADPLVRLVFVASNHASHAEYAAAALDAGKHVHVEKPPVVNAKQLDLLIAAQHRNPDQMLFLGYNRPKSPHFRQVRRALHAESGPTMINWFIVGHELPPDHWYFDDDEGGRVLGNLCHWTDASLALLGLERALPCQVVPVSDANAGSDVCVAIRFGDGSLASLNLSAKEDPFEGVRETLSVHRGGVLASLRDFHCTRIEVRSASRVSRSVYRDHGHRENIRNSLVSCESGSEGDADPVSAEYNAASARLILAVKEALQTQQTVRVTV